MANMKRKKKIGALTRNPAWEWLGKKDGETEDVKPETDRVKELG